MELSFGPIGGAIGGAAALLIAAFWRIQVLGKRKMEVAEEVLVAMQLAIDAIETCRVPLQTGGEIKAAAEFHELGEEQPSGMAMSYLTVLHRLHRHAQDFQPLQRVRVLARYFIGPGVEEQLLEILKVRAEIISFARTAAGTARQMEHRRDGPGGDFLEKATRVVTAGLGDDEIAARLDKVRREIEAACAIHFRRRAVFWPVL